MTAAVDGTGVPSSAAADLADLDSLDDHVIVLRRDLTRRPTPGQVRYSLRRAAVELAAIGLTLEVRRRGHGSPPRTTATRSATPEAQRHRHRHATIGPVTSTPNLDAVRAWLDGRQPAAPDHHDGERLSAAAALATGDYEPEFDAAAELFKPRPRPQGGRLTPGREWDPEPRHPAIADALERHQAAHANEGGTP